MSTPALLTRMSRPPRNRIASSTTRRQSAEFVTSPASAFVLPDLPNSLSARCAPAALMSLNATAAHSSRKRCTTAYPIPDAPPVTNARLFFSLIALARVNGGAREQLLQAVHALERRLSL